MWSPEDTDWRAHSDPAIEQERRANAEADLIAAMRGTEDALLAATTALVNRLRLLDGYPISDGPTPFDPDPLEAVTKVDAVIEEYGTALVERRIVAKRVARHESGYQD